MLKKLYDFRQSSKIRFIMHHWIVQIFGHNVHMDTLVTMWLCMGLLIVLAFIATRNLSVVPGKAQFLGEKVMEMFWGLTDSMIQKNGRKHVPLLASLFLFILTANLCGQVPWRIYQIKAGGELASPTNDINLTAAMAILVLLYYVYQGVKVKGFKFFIHDFTFTGIVMALIEVLELVLRPFSLALRLFANILAGELLVVAFLGIIAYVIPVPVMLFEVFVAFLQALVFLLLSTSYIAIATQTDEH